MKSTPSRHFSCNVCQRGFTRIDHLKRHQLRHSGIKPYMCLFCKAVFARCDILRIHYTDCAKRGNRKIPEACQGGRRRHACQLCTSKKLRCDGLSPCGSCRERGFECNTERKDAKDASRTIDAAAAAPDDSLPSSDKGSIQFLLNGGTDSFNERFLLPPRSDRARCLEYYNRLEKAEESPTRDLVEDEVQGYPPAFSDSDPSTLLSFQDPFFWLFNGPFDALQTLSSEPFSSDMLDPTLIPAPDGASSALSGDLIYGHEQPFATAMIQAIRAQAWAVVALDSNAQAGISIDLEYLLTTTRILKFISMYFRYWQPSCAILHRPSLDPGAISLRLLVSITFLGAMYSQDERESPVAKRLVDFAELYVFSSDVYAPEHDIGLAFAGIQKTKYTMDDCQFQDFQAGYLMCVVQYWSGSPTSRSRAMESRFSEVIKIARRTDLLRCRHQLNESADEQMWIQKECRIRTINIISLLDCAFSFYQNFPCRLTHSEMGCDFPSVESVFGSEHPFRHPKFQLARKYTIAETFRSMFEDHVTGSQGTLSTVSPEPFADVTVLDLFTLIHLLYVFVNEHMTLQDPALRLGTAASQSSGEGIAKDSIGGSIRTALSQWRDHWQKLRATISNDEWASMGFYKNGYSFWLVLDLLTTKAESVEVVRHIEVNCDDKLKRLNVLLQGGSVAGEAE